MRRKTTTPEGAPTRNPVSLVWRYGASGPVVSDEEHERRAKRQAGRGAKNHDVVLSDAVEDQMRLAHNLRNDLVRRWKDYESAVDAIWRSVGEVADGSEELDQALDEVRAVRAQIKAAHSSARERATPPELAEALTAAKTRYSEAKATLKAAKATHGPGLVERFAANKSAAMSDYTAIRKAATGIGQLHWATANAVLDGHRSAIERVETDRASWTPDSGRGYPVLRFSRWDGTGTLSVQVQRDNDRMVNGRFVQGKPARTPALLSSGSGPYAGVLRIPPVAAIDPTAWSAMSRSERKARGRAVISLRVATATDKTPIWADVPVQIHRPLPPEAEVTNAELVITSRGAKRQAAVCLTVALPEPTASEGTGRAVVHIGWRAMPDRSLRVATFRLDRPGLQIPGHLMGRPDAAHPCAPWVYLSSDGRSGELRLPPEWRHGVAVADGIGADLRRSIDGSPDPDGPGGANGKPTTLGGIDSYRDVLSHRDRRFEEAKVVAIDWVSGHPEHAKLLAATRIHHDGTTETISITAAVVRNWRNKAHMHNLLRRWHERVPSPRAAEAQVLALLDAWASKDKHLQAFADGLGPQLIAARQDAYRVFAAALAEAVGEIAIDDIKVAPLAKSRDADRDPGQSAIEDAAASNRQVAAASELRQAIRAAASRRGVRTTVVPAANITTIHEACGTKVERAYELILRCPTCGIGFDQDENAVANMLKYMLSLEGA